MKNALTAKRLSDTLNACGLTAKELADKSGVSKNSISQYINGVHAPSNISAGKMAKVLGVSPVWLMGLDVPAESPRRFPILGAVACGEPILMECDFDLYVEKDIKADFVLRAKGDSMKDARILDGDLVFVKSQPTVENGQIAVVAVDDSATLKRFYKYGDLIVLRACNPDFPDIEIKETDNKRVVVLGLAVAFQSLVK